MFLCRTKDLIPTRAFVGVMIFSACFMSYVLRVNMSINLIAMVEPTGAKTDQGHVAECLAQQHKNTTENSEKLTSTPNYGERYDWDSEVQGLILGSYFWGYILTSIPGGLLAERFGPLRTIGISTILSGALNILIPLSASWHYGVVITARFFIGTFGGVVYPSLHCLISRWSPPVEKGKFTGALLGGTLGTVVTWPVLGAVIEHFGWSWAFFTSGILCLLWCILWFMCVTDTPDLHPRISEDEKMYIAKCVGSSVNNNVKAMPPYKEMFLSIPFWAYAVLHFGNLWALYLLLTAGPKFMSEVLGFNLGHSGILASLPYLARMLFGFVFGFIGDFIRKKSWLTVTATRKTFVIFSHMIPGIFLISQTLIGCDAVLAVVFLTMSLGMNGASTLTSLQNSQDLAPNFAGTVYGVVNCIGGTTGFLTPMLTGYITKENNGLHEWHIIFWIGASVYIGSGIVFCIFGSGEQQKWNTVEIKEAQKNGIENPAFENAVGDTKEQNTKV